MTHRLKKEKNYSYIEAGEGTPIIVLHGLMGGLSNFDAVIDFFSKKVSFHGHMPNTFYRTS